MQRGVSVLLLATLHGISQQPARACLPHERGPRLVNGRPCRDVYQSCRSIDSCVDACGDGDFSPSTKRDRGSAKRHVINNFRGRSVAPRGENKANATKAASVDSPVSLTKAIHQVDLPSTTLEPITLALTTGPSTAKAAETSEAAETSQAAQTSLAGGHNETTKSAETATVPVSYPNSSSTSLESLLTSRAPKSLMDQTPSQLGDTPSQLGETSSEMDVGSSPMNATSSEGETTVRPNWFDPQCIASSDCNGLLWASGFLAGSASLALLYWVIFAFVARFNGHCHWQAGNLIRNQFGTMLGHMASAGTLASASLDSAVVSRTTYGSEQTV